MLQFHFQCLFATAEKPRLGLIVTVAAGSANIILDFVFVGIFKWALVGAAVATVISQIVGGLAPLIYFGRKNTSLLRLTKFHFNGKALLKTLTNGSSEFLSNVSMSLVSMLYNIQLLRYSGENGVAAYGVLMYVGMIFQSIFIGYAVGSAPIVSYNYGAERYDELKNLKKRGTSIIIASSIMMLLFGEIFGKPFSRVFVGYDEELLDITAHAFAIFSFSFLFSGYSIFGSSFFTALNNGLISALISVLRTLVFQVLFVLILPIFLGLDGVWLSIIGAEVASVLVTQTFMIKLKKRYNY